METRGRPAKTEYTDIVDIGRFRALTLSLPALRRDTRAGDDPGQDLVTTVIRLWCVKRRQEETNAKSRAIEPSGDRQFRSLVRFQQAIQQAWLG